RGPLPARPGPPRDRDLPRPAARRLGRQRAGAADDDPAGRRRPARRALRARSARLPGPARGDGHGSRAPLRRLDPGDARVLPRRARLRPDGPARRGGGIPQRRRLPPPRRRQHVGEPRCPTAAAGLRGAAARDDRPPRRGGARPGRRPRRGHGPGAGGSARRRDRARPLAERAPPRRGLSGALPNPGPAFSAIPVEAVAKPVEQLTQVIVRFAGDSGDGMQLTGSQFTSETAIIGNDISTLPDFPAEIRAPAGSLPGVSGFQLHFADHDILTPGDAPNVLVAMNPAALKTNLKDLPKGGTLIVDADAFTERNLQKAGYAQNPLEDGSLDEYQVHAVPLTSLTVGALKEIEGVTPREAERSKNMFALGLMSWLYGRSIKPTIGFLEDKFGTKRPEIAAANIKALRAGYAFGETTESFAVTYEVKPAKLAPGTYRNITGNQALSLGLVAASRLSGLPLFLGAYPITPASAILEELAGYKHFGVRTFQAEDEIAAVGAAVGAAFGGALGITTSAGPGVVLKAETVGLAIMLELPLLICDIQRAGPSTGMPTKPEQGDLLMVLYGRNSESPVPVVAAGSPSDCFHAAIEAARIALKYRPPVYP